MYDSTNVTIFRSNITLDGKGNEASAVDGSFDPFAMFAQNASANASPGGTLRSGHRVAYKMDMGIEEQQEWEEAEMEREVEFKKCHIDPAPFQLVEKTSLLKVELVQIQIANNTQIEYFQYHHQYKSYINVFLL